jgi:hypothetical protein
MTKIKKTLTITRKGLATQKTTNSNPNEYLKYYPSIKDSNFNKKISQHSIFNRYKLRRNTKKIKALYQSFINNIPLLDSKKKGNIRILKPTQKLLRNFMSPYSPYRGLLIYHEMGVGKTCTAITIAEALKNLVLDSDKKIYVLRWEEIERQIFDINAVARGEPLKQCTGNTYLQDNSITTDDKSFSLNELELLADKCSNGNNESCEQLSNKVDKNIKKTYKFMGTKSWARLVNNHVNSKTKNIVDEQEKKKRIYEIINDMFNNSIIIIDEAHELRSNNLDKESKIVPPVLEMVLKNTNNLRLILLSATPIYDKPGNIISLLNYLLLNDKREPIRESNVFDIQGNLKAGGKEILINNSRGYISFLRGSNPFDFPIRISSRHNIPNHMIDLNNYPTRNIKNVKLDKDDKIKYLDLVNAPLQGSQKDVLMYYIKNNEIPDIDINKIDDYENIGYSFEFQQSDIDTPGNIKQLDEIIDHESNNVKNNLNSLSSRKSLKQDLKSKKSIKIPDDDIIGERAPFYQFEMQISNFVYQSIEDANYNIKLTYGNLGLSQVASLIPGKKSYKFNNPDYGKRFQLDTLKQWGIKIAMAIESAMKSAGPVFIYTFFNASGVLPLAFALEMNGFRRYKQWGNPILENPYKDNTYRGDYIVYSGDVSLSQYAKEYLDLGQNMVKEKNVKVFIGSKKASEGLNLFGYREVHIIDPWHNINLIEQSIGRVIRTGSHLHLPPQERNVTVYQYATTLPDRESIDLTVYKICEDKAIKAGIVEKLLKENAFDCELNEAENIYDEEHYGNKIPIITSYNIKINVNLADQPFSRGCFYMQDCNFKCLTSKTSKDLDINNVPLIKFNYEKEAEEYRYLIMELMKTAPNVKIDNLKRYLKKYVYDLDDEDLDNEVGKNIQDEDSFNLAIQDIINTDTIIRDHLGRLGKIVISGEYLRFIPEGNTYPNMSLQKQYLHKKNLLKNIDLKGYIATLKDEQKKLSEEEKYNYNDILSKYIIEKGEQVFYNTISKEFRYNIKLKMDEIFSIIFDKLIYGYKLTILKVLLDKIIKGVRLNDIEKRVEHVIKNNIVYMSNIFPDRKKDKDNIYGFIIMNESKLELWSALESGGFENDSGNINKIKEFKKDQLNKTPMAKLYGYLKYEKHNSEPSFKVTDLSMGEKKSVTGGTCVISPLKDILKKIKIIDSRILRSENFQYSKNIVCNDLEVLLKRNDNVKLTGKKWYYTPEEYHIYF